LVGESCGVHHGGQVSKSWAQLAARIFFPANGRKTGGGLWIGGEDAKATFPVAVGGEFEVAPAKNMKTCSCVWIEFTEVSKEIAERPAGVCGISTRIDESDGLVMWRDRRGPGGIVVERGDLGIVDEEEWEDWGPCANHGEDGCKLWTG